MTISTIEKDEYICKNRYNIFTERYFWFCSSAVLALKFLFIPAYHSTDFEVHRNWMALTYQLPLRKWYYENTSEWTLDYPPFFAYFEFLISQFASFFIPSALVIQQKPFFSYELLLFQRITVIVSDFLYVGSLQSKKSSAGACCVLLITNSTLIMVDNIHFQYNGILTAFFIFSFNFALNGSFLMAAAVYCFLLNMKHIYLYYSLAYGIFCFTHYLLDFNRFIRRCLCLFFAIIIPFLLSFVIARMFPFQRGLTHAYWAPNIWAIYNLVDLILYRLLKYFHFIANIPPPNYTLGLVQEFSHAILPSISASTSLIIILLLFSPCLLLFMSKRSYNFPLLLTHSAFAFFLAGYHVHEKAIILIIIPYTILAFLVGIWMYFTKFEL
ncbi:unnamed protein product [Dracunculus medinensis]|uniref:Alpha-1,3-glucosyltransferase n=1 Tax=Dracunculus medinensis TaxID=318479 RepID=A0A0N4UMV7_DRAME|nr:unnamed protein product [Dracunculus medinensis]